MINITNEKTINIVRFQTDRINAFNVETIKNPILQLIEEQHNKILIDFSGVDYIDSTGFAMFLHFRRVAGINYSIIKLCGMSETIKSLFNTLNLNSFFDIYSNTETCLQSFQA